MSRRTRSWFLFSVAGFGLAASGWVLVAHQGTASAEVSRDSVPELEPGPAPDSRDERKKAAEKAFLKRTEEAHRRLERLQQEMVRQGKTDLAARMSQRLADMDEMKREHGDKLAEMED